MGTYINTFTTKLQGREESFACLMFSLGALFSHSDVGNKTIQNANHANER